MKNPWKEIDLSDYENHMSLSNVFQLQTMNKMMKEQFSDYPVHSVMILGVAGGNGLEHIDCSVIEKVYGVDINKTYLDICQKRYPSLQGTLEILCADLTDPSLQLPYADLLIANLLIEYIGYPHFQNVINQVAPQYVSCGIQINTDSSFVSDSPYLYVFDRLKEVHHQMEESALMDAMKKIGYKTILIKEYELPNGKKLVRMNFAR